MEREKVSERSPHLAHNDITCQLFLLFLFLSIISLCVCWAALSQSLTCIHTCRVLALCELVPSHPPALSLSHSFIEDIYWVHSCHTPLQGAPLCVMGEAAVTWGRDSSSLVIILHYLPKVDESVSLWPVHWCISFIRFSSATPLSLCKVLYLLCVE